MKCVEVETRLPALLDGELDPEAVVVIEAHLTTCRICSQARDEMSAALQQAREWHIVDRNIDEFLLRQISQDEICTIMQEMQLLRREVSSLHREIVDLKSRIDILGESSSGRECSVLRFPYSREQTAAHHIL